MSGENILHFGAIRLRVTGSGNLIPTFFSFDSVRSKVLTSLVMSATTAIEPTRLANFSSQRAMLQVKTTVIDETFKINRILIFAKELYTSYPG